MKEGSVRRLSLIRVLIAILIFVGMGYASVSKVTQWQEVKSTVIHKPWFAAYVDVTAMPTYAFEQLNASASAQAILSFIVSSPSNPCVPTWGAYYTMDEAGTTLDLDRRIARLQQLDGKVAISFGGALNDELALKCTDSEKLLQAYQSVVDRYKIDTVDLDLENESLKNVEALTRRAKVIAQLQTERRAVGKSLAVWLTIPVSPQGLTVEGTEAVTQMLTNGVDLAGVNVMTMDYGDSRAEDQTMLEASQRALIETHRQLGILYQQAGISLSSGSLWNKIGATPMIGQNDVVAEIFTLEDAVGLNQFALDHGVGRMSMWSANRDVQCGDNYVDLKVVSDSCSGVKGSKFSFMKALSVGFIGDLAQNSFLITKEDEVVDSKVQEVDDPAKSPYQIWSETGVYLKGTKVVWHGNVYEAKWWTKNEMPDNPVLQYWETAWQLIGPVLPGEKPIEKPTVPDGTYPEWSGTELYDEGDRVIFENISFQAKWWNQGQSPAASAINAESSPWKPLTDREIKEIVEKGEPAKDKVSKSEEKENNSQKTDSEKIEAAVKNEDSKSVGAVQGVNKEVDNSKEAQDTKKN